MPSAAEAHSPTAGTAGTLHANLNGRLAKDFEQRRRTLIADDGMKITRHRVGAKDLLHRQHPVGV